MEFQNIKLFLNGDINESTLNINSWYQKPIKLFEIKDIYGEEIDQYIYINNIMVKCFLPYNTNNRLMLSLLKSDVENNIGFFNSCNYEIQNLYDGCESEMIAFDISDKNGLLEFQIDKIYLRKKQCLYLLFASQTFIEDVKCIFMCNCYKEYIKFNNIYYKNNNNEYSQSNSNTCICNDNYNYKHCIYCNNCIQKSEFNEHIKKCYESYEYELYSENLDNCNTYNLKIN